MATRERRRPVNLPLRMTFDCNSGYTSPAIGDIVYLSGNMEVAKVADASTSNKIIGEVFDNSADGDSTKVIVELWFMFAATKPSGAAIAAVGPGVFSAQKVITFVSGTHGDDAMKVMCCNTAAGADEDVVVLYPMT